jgi:hypothetical protein
VNKLLVKDDFAEAAVKQREICIQLLEGQLKVTTSLIARLASWSRKVSTYSGLVDKGGLNDSSTGVCFLSKSLLN